MKETVNINNTLEIVNHIEKNALTPDVTELVEKIKDKIKRNRHKWVDKLLVSLKEEASIDYDLVEFDKKRGINY